MGGAQAVGNAFGAGFAALKGAGIGLVGGGVVAVNLYWKPSGKQHDSKSAMLTEKMSLYQADHDTVMSAMLCRLMYTLDGRLLKVAEATPAYCTLEGMRTKSNEAFKITKDMPDWPVVTCVGDLELVETSTILSARANAKCQSIAVKDIVDWKDGDFLSILPSTTVASMMGQNEKVQIKNIDRNAKTIELIEPLKSEHAKGIKVYKTLKYVEIMLSGWDTKFYIEDVPGKTELVSGRKADINPYIKNELGGAVRSGRRRWFRRSMFHPGGALSPSYCSVIAHDEHDSHEGKVSDTGSRYIGEPCKILAHDEADPMRRVMFQDGRTEWFEKDEITQGAFTISGATGDAEVANGTWYKTGTHHDKPIYENGGGCLMKWEDGLQNLGTPCQAKWVVQCGDQYLYYHEKAVTPPARIGWFQCSSASAVRLNNIEAHHGKVCRTASRCVGEPCNIFAHDEADPVRMVMFKDGRIDRFEKDEITQGAFTISGASGDAKVANGTWYKTGTHNDKPIYENGGGCLMKWEDGLQNLGAPGQAKWVVSCGDQDLYFHEKDSVPPAQTGWLQCSSASAIRLNLSVPAPVTLYIAWQGTMFDKRPMDIFTDLGAAPVKAGLWHESFPDLWVHSAMYSKVQNDALGQTEVILELIRAYDVKRIVFCGHSLGGGLARIAHVVTLATFKKMKEHEKSIVKNVHVQSITWAAPMVLFEPVKQAKRLLSMPDGTKRPISQEDFRWLRQTKAQLERIEGGTVSDAPQDVAKEANDTWIKFPESKDSDHILEELQKQLQDNSVNHIFDKDVVPQLPGNHHFFKPALQMAASSLIEQHLPIMQKALADAANDFASQAFLEGALANNCNELENFSHMCTVKVYTPTQEPRDVTSKKDLPAWTKEPDDSYQYLAACHSMIPNNMQGCSTLTLGAETDATIIHVVSTHDWRTGDCLLICSEAAHPPLRGSMEEVQIEDISKTKIILKNALQHYHAAGDVVRKEPRRIRDKSGKWGTYIGPLVLGRIGREGIVQYDSTVIFGNSEAELFVGHFDKDGQLSDGVVGSLTDLTKPKFTVQNGEISGVLNNKVWETYKGKWEQFCFMYEENQIDALKNLQTLKLADLKEEASKVGVEQKAIVAAAAQGDPNKAIIELIYLRKPAELVKKVKASLAKQQSDIDDLNDLKILQKKKLADLKEEARKVGVEKELIDGVDDASDPNQAIIELIYLR